MELPHPGEVGPVHRHRVDPADHRRVQVQLQVHVANVRRDGMGDSSISG
ncbi:hypothetical protein ACQPYE_30875 [Actinosynnema sp. CA-299493]